MCNEDRCLNVKRKRIKRHRSDHTSHVRLKILAAKPETTQVEIQCNEEAQKASFIASYTM